jgi:hypothetical protein
MLNNIMDSPIHRQNTMFREGDCPKSEEPTCECETMPPPEYLATPVQHFFHFVSSRFGNFGTAPTE